MTIEINLNSFFKNFLDKDRKDWEDFIYNGEKLPNKDIKKINSKTFNYIWN